MKRAVTFIMACAMTLALAACGSSSKPAFDGVLTVGMECAYAPYNWAQSDDSNGAVPISNVPGSYANGYDVMIAKKIAEANGWELEIKMMDWESLVPAVQTGEIDCAIAGQSMTPKRAAQVDFTDPYLYASVVVLTKADSPLAGAEGISQLSGRATSQRGTIWYDTCLPQIPNAEILSAQDTAPSMLMALETGAVDFVATDIPTARGAVRAYPDLTILDFNGSDDNFQVAEEEIKIAISVQKGNSTLRDAMNSVLSGMTTDEFDALLNEAVAIQPIG